MTELKMTTQKQKKIEKRASALRDNLKRRKMKEKESSGRTKEEKEPKQKE